MFEKCVLVQHLNNVNDVIKQPLLLTQRIKFISFDVSQKFIIFGASSGGIYVFSRNPCQFIKLVPTKEGSVTNISISPDENVLAVTSNKGLVIIIENFITENNTFYKAFSEHEGNIITALRWHGNEIYCGDDSGKVSVVVAVKALAKVLFHPPCISLMQLDSSIVQIDSFSKFLLISSQTRTYLCDTEKEQYRQIGKKLRDGYYGACFLNRNPFEDNKCFEKNANAVDDVKIFCARPGARLWEARFDASVTCTHQFKNSLSIPPTAIVHLDESLESHLNISEFSTTESRLQETFNFTRCFVFAKRYIFTFNDDGFYILDSESVELAFWSKFFGNIKDIKLLKNLIFLWTGSELKIISLMTVENLVIKTMIDKQYYVCAQLCSRYMDHLLSVVHMSDKIHLLVVLGEKLENLNATNLLEEVLPLLKAIKEHSAKKINAQKLKSGLVLLNSHLVHDDVIDKCEEASKVDQNLTETFQTLKEISTNMTEKLTESTKNFREKVENLGVAMMRFTVDNINIKEEITCEKLTINELKHPTKENIEVEENAFENNTNKELVIDDVHLKKDSVDDGCDNINNLSAIENSIEKNGRSKYMEIFSEQYELNLINDSIQLPQFNEIISSSTYDVVLDLLHEFLNLKSQNGGTILDKNLNKWCYEQYLKWFSKNSSLISSLAVQSKAFQFLVQSFVSVNSNENLNCACNFPLPSVKSSRVKYYDTGCAILKKLFDNNEEYSKVCVKIPFMWKFVLKDLRSNEDLALLLPYIIQLSEEDVLSAFSAKIAYDNWDEATKLLIKVKNNICANCNRVFDGDLSNSTFSWSYFGSIMMKSVGGPCTVKLLKRYSSSIPANSLDQNFYQTCIFATVFDNMHDGLRNQAVDLAKATQEDGVWNKEFDAVMRKFLNKKYMQRTNLCVPKNGVINIEARCPACDLPFNAIILEEVIRLSCGHVFHKFCKIREASSCEVCK